MTEFLTHSQAAVRWNFIIVFAEIGAAASLTNDITWISISGKAIYKSAA